MADNAIQVISVISSAVVSIIATASAIYIARLNRHTSTSTQFRKVWVDTLTDAISTFISMAEMISMLEIDDEDDLYLDYFKELSKMHNRVLLMLNQHDEEHVKLAEHMEELRDVIHDENIDDDKISEIVDSKVIDILEVSSGILKKEWDAVINC